MASNTVHFQKPATGEIRSAPIGFSWTTFFFGFFPALFRGDWKWGIIMVLVAMVTVGLSWLVFPFIYNSLYAKDLVRAGFKVKSVDSGTVEQIGLKLGMQLERIESSS